MRGLLLAGGALGVGVIAYMALRKPAPVEEIAGAETGFNDLGDTGSVPPPQRAFSSDWTSLGAELRASLDTFQNFASDGPQKIADAIAYAEGFFVNGSRPQRNHNPGDLTKDLGGQNGVGFDGPYVVYANDTDGWGDLLFQVNLWLAGKSQYASGSSSIVQVSRFYTSTDQDAWARNVASRLGVNVNTRLQDI